MNIEKLTPRLRFSGFSDSWEQYDFNESFDSLGSNSLSRSKLTFERRTTQNVHYGDVLIKFGSLLDVSMEIIPYIEDENTASKFLSSLLKNGDVVIADAAEDNTVGKVTEIAGMNNSKVVSGLHTIPCRPRKSFEKGYLGYYMNSNAYHDQLLPLIQGTKVSSISKTALKETTICFPKSASEQSLIGKYLVNLDHYIALQQQEYNKLVILKKAMLDEMFPQKGKNLPEVRFKEFTVPWEQRKVGELLTERNEQAPMSDEYPLMAFIAYEGVAPKGDRYDRSSLVSDTENKLYKKTELGDFIYSSNNLETGSIGLNKYGKASVSPVYSIFRPTSIADSDFLGRRLVRKDFINAMVKWRQGVVYGQWRIHESDFEKIEIPVPSVEEQRKIGAFLDNLDNLITLHKRKIDKLKNIKAGCLEKMFV